MTRRVGLGMASIVRRTTAQIIDKSARKKEFRPHSETSDGHDDAICNMEHCIIFSMVQVLDWGIA